jgi:hypothetical protein
MADFLTSIYEVELIVTLETDPPAVPIKVQGDVDSGVVTDTFSSGVVGGEVSSGVVYGTLGDS